MSIDWEAGAKRPAAHANHAVGPRISNYSDSTLLASSAGLGWSTIFAELRSYGVGESPVTTPQHVEISVVIVGNKNALVTRIASDQCQKAVPKNGTIWLSPIGVGYKIAASAPVPKAMHLYLPITTFRRLSDEFNLPGAPVNSIRSVAGIRDEVINSIALSLLSEITHETATGRMYAETASLMLAGRIIQNHCDGGSFVPHTPVLQPLDDARLKRVLDYMAERISDKITLEELAKVACFSTFHFARVFTLAVGVPPHRHLSRMRLESAMAALATSRLALSEIALKTGFSSQAGFNRAFRRATGMTPGEYRQRRTGMPSKTKSVSRFESLPSQRPSKRLTAAVKERLFAEPSELGADAKGLPSAQLQRVVEYLSAHLPKHVELADLAALAGLSQAHFSRAFKASTGMAPYRWQLDARIRRAQALLIDTNASLDDVAEATGFADAVHFGRTFRKLTGTTPAAWRHDRKTSPPIAGSDCQSRIEQCLPRAAG
jgi:AraC family transcriptional regulator